MNGKPLLVFHGGNSTTAYNLLMYKFLIKDFHVYAIDTIGHPGKSDEICLSSNNYDYGKWASGVITAIGYDKINCFGVSFGGGILAKLMCIAPEKIEKAVLVVRAEKECLFPAKRVLSRAEAITPNCKIHMLKECGHMHIMPQYEKKMIVDFLIDSYLNSNLYILRYTGK